MKYINLLFIVMAVLVFNACGNKCVVEPIEEEIVFCADKKEYVGPLNVDATIAFNFWELTFENTEVKLTIKLSDSSSDPLIKGREINIDANGSASNFLRLDYLNSDGSIDGDNYYIVSSGFMRIDEYDRDNEIISITFDMVLEKVLDSEAKIPFEGVAKNIQL